MSQVESEVTHLPERDAVARPADAAPGGIAGLSPAHHPTARVSYVTGHAVREIAAAVERRLPFRLNGVRYVPSALVPPYPKPEAVEVETRTVDPAVIVRLRQKVTSAHVRRDRPSAGQREGERVIVDVADLEAVLQALADPLPPPPA